MQTIKNKIKQFKANVKKYKQTNKKPPESYKIEKLLEMAVTKQKTFYFLFYTSKLFLILLLTSIF